MNAEQENFDALRRLLALKRHEQPPPRFFNDFSAQVIERIREEGMRGHAPSHDIAWLHRLWAVFETKPLLAGVFGAALCALMITGIVYSEKGSPESQVVQTPFEPSAVAETTPAPSPFVQSAAAESPSMTGVTVQNQDSLFDAFKKSDLAGPAPVNFPAPAGN
jgi:hypothetical protein